LRFTETVGIFGFAAHGVYLAKAVTCPTGGLLPHPFTLTPQPKLRGGLLSVALAVLTFLKK